MSEEVALAGFVQWAKQHWDPDDTLRSWWNALGEAGWAYPSWPSGLGGRGLSPSSDGAIRRLLADEAMVPPPDGLGQMMGGPVLAQHGTEAQQKRYLPRLAKGLETWCQLFSEPAAGSDLAGVRTTATRDGDTWVVSGQKVWTSGAHLADRGLLLARSDASVPKHRGMTYFVIDMNQPGVEVRPLRDMSGEAFFGEVFIEGATVSDEDRVGEPGAGWSVALSTLAFERAGLALREGIGPQVGPLRPGRRAGMLDRRVGDLVAAQPDERSATNSTARWREPSRLEQLAADRGKSDDPILRQRLATYRSRHLTAMWTRERARGTESARLAPLAKLAASSLAGPARDIAACLLGPEALLSDADGDVADVIRMMLLSPASAIAGGTDEVQRNIIGERVLGLPAEPRLDRHRPFRELP